MFFLPMLKCSWFPDMMAFALLVLVPCLYDKAVLDMQGWRLRVEMRVPVIGVLGGWFEKNPRFFSFANENLLLSPRSLQFKFNLCPFAVGGLEKPLAVLATGGLAEFHYQPGRCISDGPMAGDLRGPQSHV